MIQKLCSWILFSVLGYTRHVTEEHPAKYIIALAPHTSNWDFIIGHLYAGAIGIRCNFMIKEEWFFWPLGYVMKAIGGIPIKRTKSSSTTDQLAIIARKSDSFQLCITPEGTRKPNAEWKKGFYYISLKADLPILLYGLDYERKLIECTKTFRPTGDIDKELAEVKAYFSQYKGRHPEKFVI